MSEEEKQQKESESVYESMTIMDVLDKVKSENVLLPEFQRDYVWKFEQIEDLFESILCGYPIGSFIFWIPSKDSLNNNRPKLYKLLYDEYFERRKSQNKSISYPLTGENPFHIVLDGQQRITSLSIALNGTYICFKSGKGRSPSSTNSDYWEERQLYFDVNCEKSDSKKFRFLTKEQAKDENFIKIKEVVEESSFKKIKENLSESAKNDLDKLHSCLCTKHLINFYPIHYDEFDKALDVFVKVNSTGTKLTKGDLIFSRLIDGWIDGKRKIDRLQNIMNCSGFNFSKDYLMKICLVLVGETPALKIQSFNQEIVKKIQNSWDSIMESLKKMTEKLKEAGFCDKNLASYNATMPTAYYIFKGGNTGGNFSQEIKKVLTVAFAKELFSGSSDTILQEIMQYLSEKHKKEPFSLELFSEMSLSSGKNFIIDEKEIENWLQSCKKWQKRTFALISILYTDSNTDIDYSDLEVDHCHPAASFEKDKLQNELGIMDDNIIDKWQKDKDRLPNLQLLKRSKNQSKRKTPLIDWVQAGNELKYWENDFSLELKDFDNFFDQRKKKMKDKLLKFFGIKKQSKESTNN